MSLARVPLYFMATICLALAACETLPTGRLGRVIDIPLASVHSDLAFTMTSSSRQSVSCAANSACQSEAGRFSLQVQRIAAVLQIGAQALYPDQTPRAPGSPASRFDVYVVDSDEAGSASSANGRISLNAALGTRAPDDAWLAFVIAREMGHVIARHHEENSTASITTSVILNILLPGSGLLKSALSAAGSSLAARSKREVQAREADVIAFRLLEVSPYRLRDVALNLLLAPASPDRGPWSTNFRKSSDKLLALVRSTELIADHPASPRGSESLAGN